MTWREFWARVTVAAVLTPLVKLIAHLFDKDIWWWLAAVVALVVAFLGKFLWEAIDGD